MRSSRFLVPSLVVATIFASTPVHAAWSPTGVPIAPGLRFQDFPRVVSDGAGGAYVLLTESATPGGQTLRLQRLDANGDVAAGWPDGGIAPLDPARYAASAGLLDDGAQGAFVAWLSYDPDSVRIYVQHVFPSAAVDPAWPPDGVQVGVLAEVFAYPQVARDGGDGAYVAWEDLRDGAVRVFVTRLTASGPAPGWPAHGLELTVRPALPYEPPALVADGSGGVYVAFDEERASASKSDVHVHHLMADATRAPGWPASGVVLTGARFVSQFVNAVSDGAGGVVVGWDDRFLRSHDDGTIRVARLTASGSSPPGWPVDGVALSSTTGSRDGPVLCPDGSGGALAMWIDRSRGGEDLYGQRASGAGSIAPGWPAGGVPLRTGPSSKVSWSMAADGLGGAFFSWMDLGTNASTGEYRVALQHLTFEGLRASGWPDSGAAVSTLQTGQIDPSMGGISSGRAVVAWSDLRGIQANVYVQLVEDPHALGVPIGTRSSGSELLLTLPGPHPIRGALLAVIDSDRPGRGRLELLDISSRRIRSIPVVFDRPGRQQTALTGERDLGPGVYVVRMSLGGRSASQRIVVTR